MIPKVIIFDLDGTLAESKRPLAVDMAEILSSLLNRTLIAIASGGAFNQFIQQVVERLPADANLEHLYLLPTSGAALFEFKNDTWEKVYGERLPEDEALRIQEVIRNVVEQTGIVDLATPSYGDRIENRGSQVSFSALGQLAPIDEKKAWDPDKSKRHLLQTALQAVLPEYLVAMGGMTTIDITQKNVNKAFGIERLSKHLSIAISDMLYVGDELEEGGNDSVVIPTGIPTHPVTDPDETKIWLRSLLAS